jgi:membrane fusion protein, multidrug efflux system
MRVRNPLNASAILLVVLTLSLEACHKEADTSKQTPAPSGPPPAVVVAEVIQQTVPILKEFTARTDAGATVDLRARVEGILEEQLFEEGKLVKKDQVLFKIDRRPFDASVLSAQAKVQKAEADLAFALKQVAVLSAEAEVNQAKARLVKEEKELQRTTALVNQGVQTPQDLETQTAREQSARAETESREAQLVNAKLTEDANIKLASAEVAVAKSDLIQAELKLSYCTIAAPFDGLIGLVQVDVGNLVGRGETTLLATVSSLDPIRVYIGISESDYLDLSRRREKTNTPPDFEMVLADGTTHPHKGRFLMADRAVDLKTGTLSLIAEFQNPGNLLRPGQFARVRVATEQRENALLVPQRAVFEQQSARALYVVGADNKVALRTVTLNERYEDKYIVTDGVQAGEKVIVEGQIKVKPGVTVNPSDKPISQEPTAGEKGQ